MYSYCYCPLILHLCKPLGEMTLWPSCLQRCSIEAHVTCNATYHMSNAAKGGCITIKFHCSVVSTKLLMYSRIEIERELKFWWMEWVHAGGSGAFCGGGSCRTGDAGGELAGQLSNRQWLFLLHSSPSSSNNKNNNSNNNVQQQQQ